MNFCKTKNIVSLLLALAVIVGTAFVAPCSVNVKAETVTEVVASVDEYSIWSGNAASDYAGGKGTEEDPYIIETADQLYRALSTITDSTNNVAGGKQTSQMLKQGSTTEYVPVYTPYYYKVADGVKALYLNNIVGKESLDGIKACVAGSSKKIWKPGKSFVGNLDGNGATIYGMYSSSGQGFVYKLDGSATIKNFQFDSCYSKGSGASAIVTTILGSYANDSTKETIANVSVRNCYIATTRTISLSSTNTYSPGAAGLVSSTYTPEVLTFVNCLFDGYSCEIVQGTNSVGAIPTGYVSTMGGIISGGHSMNNITFVGCVSLGAPVVDELYVYGKEINYTRYDKNQGFQVYFYDSYTDYPTTLTDAYPGKYDKLLLISRPARQAIYNLYDLPELNWKKNWQLTETTDGVAKFSNATKRIIPTPISNSEIKTESFSYDSQIAAQNNNGGAYNVSGGPYPYGTYGMYNTLVGSGTEKDPYLIENAFQLARAVASGGMNVYNRLYYKLICDIDASEATWITQDEITISSSTKYKYVEFNGVIDGDGHTVSGVFAGDDTAVGIVPVLAENGVIKNLHVRNSCFVSGSRYAGAIAGEVKSGAQIIGCSVESSVVVSKKADKHIAGFAEDIAIKNSYYIADDASSVEAKSAYYNENGLTGDVDLDKNPDVWYMGGRDGSSPKLKNYAYAQLLTDVDGDGDASEYTARDLAALKNMLLLEEDYQYLYADVDRNGEINILDLVVLCNDIIGDFSNPNNDFWRNVKLGQISIYYGENDSYDAARKLELYLESAIPGIDIKKIVSANETVNGRDSDSSAVYVHANDLVGSPKGEVEIIVGDIKNSSKYNKNTLGINDYAITYDTDTGVLWFKGGSFTGVEQAVLDFVNNSQVEIGKIYTVDNAVLSEEKQAKQVYVDTNYDGKADTYTTLHYAWGDEFEGIKEVPSGENAELSLDTWNFNRMRTETEVGKGGNYNNVETANEKEISELYRVQDGKLTITRGVKAEHATATTDRLGYVRLYNQTGNTALNDSIDDDDIIANAGLIRGKDSMLFKQGYAEMYGALPSDGHVFASWWMLGHGSLNNFAVEESLYAKVYKLNNQGEYAYDGKSTWPTSTDPTTYKYQIPTNYFEIDIWELMQNNGIAHSSTQQSKLTGFYDYRLYLNVHKFYSVGARGADVVHVIDWDNPGTPRAVMQKSYFGTKEYYFSTSAAYHDFTDGKTTRFTKNWLGRVTADYVESLQKQLTAPRRYGFYWSVEGDKFNFTLYIYDTNGDGVEGDDAILATSKMTYNTDNGMKPSDYDVISDAEVANQYMYMIFDNILYTSNPKHNSSTTDNAAMHTDMLTDEGTAASPDKIDLEVEYLRIYQYDGKRDIVTRDTESFNNGNHFGY